MRFTSRQQTLQHQVIFQSIRKSPTVALTTPSGGCQLHVRAIVSISSEHVEFNVHPRSEQSTFTNVSGTAYCMLGTDYLAIIYGTLHKMYWRILSGDYAIPCATKVWQTRMM